MRRQAASPLLYFQVAGQLPCLLTGRSRPAVGEGDEFGDLAAGGVVTGAVVGTVAGGLAGFTGAAARIALDDAVGDHRFDVGDEGAAEGDIFEGGGGGRGDGVAAAEGDDLAQLAAGDVVVRAEVGPVAGGDARLR